MRFTLEGLDVFFPYPRLYKEQYEYMLELKRALDAKGHGVLEMPTGTGKTVCILALITSYQLAHPEVGKLIYCTRTVPEMLKCLLELKRVIRHRDELLGTRDAGPNPRVAGSTMDEATVGSEVKSDGTARPSSTFLGLCLSSRRNMCINDEVMGATDRESVDSKCRDRTASWVRQRAQADPNSTEHPICDYFEEYDRAGTDAAIPAGIFDLDDLKEFGRQKGWCPYFLARHVINHAKVLVYNYQYMLDPKVAGMVTRELESESVVVFDEAHNIDNVCIEALSVSLDDKSLTAASISLNTLSSEVDEMKRRDQQRLNDEYRQLVSGLQNSGVLLGRGGAGASRADQILGSPVPQEMAEEAVPGNIRRAEHFVSFMKSIVVHLKKRLIEQVQAHEVETETPLAFVHRLTNDTYQENKTLKFAYSRLNSLLRTLQVKNLESYNPLQDVADFITLVATYTTGFAIVIEPNGSVIPGVYEPTMQLACLDASLAVKPVFDRFASVVLTSGTLSPLDQYPRLLNFQPVVRQSLEMSVFRQSICPLVVTSGSDQAQMSTRFEVRDDASVVRNYGALLVDLASAVPDGIICFFTSYMYMEKIVAEWNRLHILQRIVERKLVFVETKDVVETTLAVNNFKRACDCGRGAVFLSVARGKVAEGVDFDNHYGRCVVLMGIPFQYTLSHVLRARLEYLRTTFQIHETEFLTFDALRQAAQCVGRVMRTKSDYGIMIFADSRYNRHDKRSKLPPWILHFMKDENLSLSTDVALENVKRFLKEMAQPIDKQTWEQIVLNKDELERRAMEYANDPTAQTAARERTSALAAEAAAARPALAYESSASELSDRVSLSSEVTSDARPLQAAHNFSAVSPLVAQFPSQVKETELRDIVVSDAHAILHFENASRRHGVEDSTPTATAPASKRPRLEYLDAGSE